MSFPFRNKLFTFTQPDGTKLQVRGTGDQHYAVFETSDGYTVVKDPVTGFYQYASLKDGEIFPSGFIANRAAVENLGLPKNVRESIEATRSKVFSSVGLPQGKSRWQIRREEAKLKSINSMFSFNRLIAPPQRNTIGDFTGLCIPVQFPDVPATIVKDEIDAFCNQPGYTGFGNNGSVHDYFFDNSRGKLAYINIVTSYYTAKNPKSYYTNPAIDYTIRAKELIKEALEFLKVNGFDFSQLSSDSKDCVYAVNVFYAGTSDNNWGEGLWPHQWHLDSPYPLSSGKFAVDYQITNVGNDLSLGTFCHETGHLLCDFPDLYDTDKVPFGYGIGYYCLMCFGGLADEKNPMQICAYLKFKAGWADQVRNITPGLNFEIDAASNDFTIYSKSATEYFIIENRLQEGRDSALPDAGLTIWHVDEHGSNNNGEMTSLLHYECSLVQADGKHNLEQQDDSGDDEDLFDAGSNNHFGTNTNPKSLWWDGTASGLEIFNIGPIGSTTTFSS